MAKQYFLADPLLAQTFLFNLIIKQIPKDSFTWLDQELKSLPKEGSLRKIHEIFSSVNQFVNKDKLVTTPEDIVKANNLRKGFNPSGWTIDQAVRVLIVLHISQEDPYAYKTALQSLFDKANVSEIIALYSSLPLLAFPENHLLLATQGLRSEVQPVFDAVALNNPYPSDYLDQTAWNQMVLKAALLERPLMQIYQISELANPRLARMLLEFAQERWDEGYEISPDLWQVVSPFVDKDAMPEVKEMFSNRYATNQDKKFMETLENFPADEIPAQQPRKNPDSKKMNWDLIINSTQTNNQDTKRN